MKHLLIIFHSQSGRNQSLALALLTSAQRNPSISVRLLDAFEATSTDWLWADAFILCTPENFAAISGGMKQFLDRVFYPILKAQEQGAHQAKPYFLIVDTGNDGSQCELQLHKILKGMSAKPVQDTVFIYGVPEESDYQLMASLGEGFSEALALGIF